MLIKALVIGLTLEGVDVAIDQVFETDEISGSFHVRQGMGVEVDSEGNEVVPSQEPQAPAGDAGAKTSTSEAGAGQNAAGEALALLTAAIDGVANKEVLIEEAQGLGVQFKFDAKKAEIIQAAIDQNFGEALLELLKARAKA